MRRVDKRALFETSDVISVHLGLSDRSRGTIGAPELEAMKAGAIVVNTSRGPLVDEAALLFGIDEGGASRPASTCSTSSRFRRAIRSRRCATSC